MTDWKNDLRTLADKLRAEQKNKKGIENKSDSKKYFMCLIEGVSLDLLAELFFNCHSNLPRK